MAAGLFEQGPERLGGAGQPPQIEGGMTQCTAQGAGLHPALESLLQKAMRFLEALPLPRFGRRPPGEDRQVGVPVLRGGLELGRRSTALLGLVEKLGLPVHTVPGHEAAFKITKPLDLVLAEALLR